MAKRKPRPDLAARNRARSLPFDQRYQPEPNSGCWLWLFALNKKGYGHVFWKGQATGAHRKSWEIHFGEIPNEMHVLHRCDTPCCVNPDHLFIGTNADNNADMIAKGRHASILGEQSPNAVLSENDIPKIKADKRSNVEICKDYGVSDVLIGLVKRRKAWRHIQ